MAMLSDLLESLAEALCHAAQDWGGLSRLAAPLLGDRGTLAGKVGGRDLPIEDVAFKLVQWAEANGGEALLGRLLNRALERHPGNPKLLALARQVGRRPVGAQRQLLQAAGFDLKDQVDRCSDTVLGQLEPGLRLLLVAGAVQQIVDALCQRLQGLLELDNEVPLKLTLDPRYADPAGELERVRAGWKRGPQESPLLAIVQCENASNELLADFVDRLGNEFPPPLERNLVVLVSAAPDCAPPTACVALPPPCFQDPHLYTWVELVSQGQGWSAELKADFKRWLRDQARTAQPFAAGRVYDALTQAIGWLTRNPDEATLRRYLCT